MTRILVVEDDRATRKALRELFELEGYSVDLAQDGCTEGMTDPLLVQSVLNHYTTAFFLTYLGVQDARASLTSDIASVLSGITLGGLAHA